MAQTVAVVRATLTATAAGTTDFTKSGFGVVAAALIFVCEANSGANPAVNAMMSIGFWDGTNQRVMMAHSVDGGASSTTRRSSNDAFGVLTRDANDSQYTVSAVTDGIRLTLTTDNTAIQRHCTVLLIGGVSAHTNTIVATTQNNTTESASLGHAPQIVFFTSHGTTTADTSATVAILSFGFARSDGTHRLISYGSATAAADAAVDIAYSETRAVGQYFSGTIAWSGEVTTFGSDTFTMTTRDGNSGSDVAFFLSLGGADLSFDVGTLTTATGTGPDTPIATDVPVEALLIALSTQSATGISTSGDTAHGIMIGLADADGQFAHNLSDEDAAATINANSASKADRAIDLDIGASGSPSDLVDATVDLNASDFTLDYSAVSATARKGWWFALGTDGGGGGGFIPYPRPRGVRAGMLNMRGGMQ